MGRISSKMKESYEPLGPQNKGAPCYYCGSPASMDDLTPSPKASKANMDSFSEKWTIAKVCSRCWKRIYTANIANHGAKYLAAQGCMTVDQKRNLINPTGPESEMRNRFTIVDDSLVLPADMFRVEDGPYVMGSVSFYEEEIKALQGALCLRLHRMSDELVSIAFHGAMASGHLDVEREEAYKSLLELT